MQEVKLVAAPRAEAGKAPARKLRREGMVPAVIYGLGTDTQSVSVPARALQHILAGPGGANTLIDLVVEGETVLTLAREVQRHPLRGTYLHVDFVRISRDTAITADVPVLIEGEAEGVKAGGRVNQILFTVSVSAKPGAIPQSFTLDVTPLDVGEGRKAGEIELPAGVTLVTDPDENVVVIASTRLGAAAAAERGEGEGEEGEAGEGGGEAEGGDEAEGGESSDEA
jgi:large subunit ribosomal protein L25